MTDARRPAKKAPMREVLAAAAFELFVEKGFERTTVDDIVARAGVGRRSFFRYFPSKEDVVFPDHESCLAETTAFLAAAEEAQDAKGASGTAGADPVGTVCDAARIVLGMYAAKPEFSVRRYRLTREVPGLRTYELSVVRRYEQTYAGHLRRAYRDLPDGALRAEVAAASVVAAHNNGLRLWLRSGGVGDVHEAVEHALDLVRDLWSGPPVPADRTDPAQAGPDALVPDGPEGPERDVIVMVAQRGTPMWRVVQQIEAAVGEG
ncbi:TetR family transcriptional regulator [Streptomyces sp. AM 2-1-1]|uniref:TetR family transcriptional regulator n=1 Tax=Streptomyces sp. AM 2-1-1 TaxID=3028709 RepID=UPI0023B8C14D|nr:TetR family transcriptional regulator [Streptomyces sp. AM 2-1-1]WEH38744.1 TetR family transcriptional regulator [Streptomyces sp. AM 2-1-1]